MTEYKKTILFIIVVVVVLGLFAWLVIPGLLRCYVYHNLTSKASWLARLSVKPSKIELPVNEQVSVLSLGYSQFAFEPELICSIRCRVTGLMIDCNECGFCFLPPYSKPYDTFKSDSINTEAELATMSEEIGIPISGPGMSEKEWQLLESDSVAARLTREMIEAPYSWSIKVANTMPKKYSEIFFEHSDKFKEYIMLAFTKIRFTQNDKGIGIFEGKYVRGLIRFGSHEKPGQLYAEVYSKDSNISQGIIVQSDEPEKSKRFLLSLLASYRFLITEIPDEDALRELIMTELEKHDKFQVVE